MVTGSIASGGWRVEGGGQGSTRKDLKLPFWVRELFPILIAVGVELVRLIEIYT